jgi:hypothetical protein
MKQYNTKHTENQVLDLIDDWHQLRNVNCSLREYLGFSEEEYQAFLDGKMSFAEDCGESVDK